MNTKTKISFIINGAKKLSKESQLAIEKAQNNTKFNCTLIYTTKSKEAISLSQKATDASAEIVIAVGGDGTCNEVINGIQKSSNRHKVIFGIIPNGSGNDFHRVLGAFNPDIFIDALLIPRIHSIDLIKIQINEVGVYSLNIAGAGFDGFVVNKLNQLRTKTFLKGKAAYIYSILSSFFSYKKQEVIISSENYYYSGRMLMTAVCNGTTFGQGLVISPNAKIDDGKFSVTLLGNVSLMDYLKNILRLKRGELIKHPEVHYFETEELTISTTSEEMYIEADGELFGHGNVHFQVIKKSIQLLMPDYQK